MSRQQSNTERARAWFAVDGTRVDVSHWHWYPHRWAGGAFTADYRQMIEVLPSPPLYPVRLSRNRALVCAWGAYVPAVGHAPPFLGFGEVALMAFVTKGEKPAPPLIPGMGRRAMDHYGFGFFPVMTVVTNLVAAELYRVLLGFRAAVADIRVEQRVDRERFVCEGDGRLVWDLTVRTDGRPAAGDPGTEERFYAVEDGEVYRVSVSGSGVSRSRYGSKSAGLVVGQHALADPVRRLDLSRSWAAEFMPDRQLWLAGPPEGIGDTRPATKLPVPRPAAQGRLVVSPQPGVEFEVDQRRGWDLDAAYTGSGLRERADSGRSR
jgi:hypothetical protein